MKTLLTTSAVILSLFSFLPARLHAVPPQYSVTVLDDLGSPNPSYGRSINSSGQVSGYYYGLDQHQHAVIWTGTTATVLGNPGGVWDEAYSINNSGQVAGRFRAMDGGEYAVRWTGTTQTDIFSLGYLGSLGYGINASGQIAGSAFFPSSGNHAVRWTGTTATDLGGGEGYGINSSGKVVGYYINTNGDAQAALWTDGLVIALGTYGLRGSAAYGINDSGQIVGGVTFRYNSGVERMHAVLWTGTVPFDLGTLGGLESEAHAINASGDVTGYSQIAGGAARYFLYTGGVMYDLSTLLVPGSGVTLLSLDPLGNSINDFGQIAASGQFGGKIHALRLTPMVPDLTLEQPAGTTLTDGASTVSHGIGFVGVTSARTFTVRNVGTAELNSLAVSFDGTNAGDFAVTTALGATTLAPNASTTFTVTFNRAIAGIRTAALHLASNVPGSKNPFDITLSGRALAPDADDDGDGLTNQQEANLSALGLALDPVVDNTALLTQLRSNGLYRASDMQTLVLGSPVLARDSGTGTFRLSLGVQKSPNLTTWTPLTGFTPSYDAPSGTIFLDFTDASNAEFFRVLGAKP